MRRLDVPDLGQRDARILRAPMEHHRAFRLRVLVCRDVAAVVADRRVDGRARRREPRHGAAHAEADDADLAGAPALPDRRLDVLAHLVPLALSLSVAPGRHPVLAEPEHPARKTYWSGTQGPSHDTPGS